jgi:2-oxoisovalerate dehydrogenase E1 component
MPTTKSSPALHPTAIPTDTLLKAWELMCTAKAMTELYEANAKFTAKYVHATSRGHEAIQLALGTAIEAPGLRGSLLYRDDSILLGIGMEPYELMLQLHGQAGRPLQRRPHLLRAP